MRNHVIEAGLTYFEIDVSSQEGNKLAREFHVQSIPTLIFGNIDSIMEQEAKTPPVKFTPIKSMVGLYPVVNIKEAMREVGYKSYNS
jgi:thioredoxin-related protein